MRKIEFILVLLAGIVYISIAAANDSKDIEESCPAGGDCGSSRAGMRYLAFEKVLMARKMLDIYCESMLVMRDTVYNDPVFKGQINYNRAEILDMAIQAYYLCGPINYSNDSNELMATIQDEELPFPNYQWPSSLDELVSCGMIDFLPQSPYENSRFLSKSPEDGGLPGDVVYCSYPTINKGYFHLDPGKNENCLLFVIGRPGVFALPKESLPKCFLGEMDKVLPVPPENIVFLTGQLYPENVE